MDFLAITNEELDNIDLSPYSQRINSLEYQQYFMSKSGQEHYRLLSYISQKNNLINILDIGTLKGCSALAFSVNETNKVHSFNVGDELDLNLLPSNTKFIIDNILKSEYENIVLSSEYIMLDTYHDGVFEKQFLDYLVSINYKGYLLLDDIYLNSKMKTFWNSITKEKYDLTRIGHSTGTGVVYFN
jgi:hypothetical protein